MRTCPRYGFGDRYLASCFDNGFCEQTLFSRYRFYVNVDKWCSDKDVKYTSEDEEANFLQTLAKIYDGLKIDCDPETEEIAVYQDDFEKIVHEMKEFRNVPKVKIMGQDFRSISARNMAVAFVRHQGDKIYL